MSKQKEVAVLDKPSTSIQLNADYDPTAVAETVTYYRYCPETFVALDPVSVEPSAKAPDNTTRWAPPQCRAGTQAYFDGFGWVRCPTLRSITPELLRRVLTDVAKRELRNALTVIKAGAAEAETETYLQQYTDAQSYVATGYASTFLKVLSEARNKPLEVLARTIVRKADAYHTLVAKAVASYQNTIDDIAETEPVLTQALLQERRLQRV